MNKPRFFSLFMMITLTSLIFLMFCVSAGFAQTEITIKKKTSFKIPGMPAMPAGMPAGTENPFEPRTSTVYIKGGNMRTDMPYKLPKKTGGKETVTQTMIMQCGKQRMVTYNSKKKKYYVESMAGETAANTKNSKKGGYVTITGSVTDTGERAKLFGYEARHLKQNFTMTPSKDACQKETMQIEIEGWYADIPEFSCPIKRKPSEFKMDNNCFDDVDFQIKGTVTGVPLKEVKKITMQGMTISIEEETVELTKNALSDALFEPPANYKAANTLKEVEDDSPDDSTQAADTTPQAPSTSSNSSSPTFAPPAAGLEKAPLTEKQAGRIRIGVAKPKVTTPDSKKDPDAGADIAVAAANSLVEALKAENVEAILLESEAPENEAREKSCDYIFYANITQKRGGGMFKSMVMMGAVTMAGAMIPGIGGMVASTVASQVMGQTMGKNAKAKDEFTLDYKVVGLDASVLAQAAVKTKTEKDGEDVLSPQIKQASTAVLGEIAKKQR